MNTSVSRSHSRLARRLSWLVVAGLTTAALVGPSAGSVLAGNKTEITICHATGSQSNPYVQESPAINSSGAFEGELSGGHNDHTGPVWFEGIDVAWGDIIPPYDYDPTDFHYPGLNWDAAGQAIWNNECSAVTTTTSTSSTESTQTSSTESTQSTETTASTTESTQTTASTTESTQSTETTASTTQSTQTTASTTQSTQTTQTTATTASTTQSTATTASTTQSTESTPTGEVEGATGTPDGAVLPATDTVPGTPAAPSNDSWRLILLAMAGLLAGTLLLSPTEAVARRSNR